MGREPSISLKKNGHPGRHFFDGPLRSNPRAGVMAAAQEADLAALDQIGDGCGSLTGIAAATGNGENEIAEGKLGPVDFA